MVFQINIVDYTSSCFCEVSRKNLSTNRRFSMYFKFISTFLYTFSRMLTNFGMKSSRRTCIITLRRPAYRNFFITSPLVKVHSRIWVNSHDTLVSILKITPQTQTRSTTLPTGLAPFFQRN